MYLRSFKRIIDRYGEWADITRVGKKYTDQNTGKLLEEDSISGKIKLHWQPYVSTMSNKGAEVMDNVPERNKIQGMIIIYTYSELILEDILTIAGVKYIVKKVDPWHGHWESLAIRQEYQNAY